MNPEDKHSRSSVLHGRWLRNRLPAWTQEGLVTPEAAEILRQRYEPGSSLNAASLIISCLAAVAIGIGIIALFSHNWDDLGPVTRSALGLGQLLAVGTLGVLARHRYGPWRVATEATAVLWFFSLGAALGIIGQAWQMGGSLEGLLLTWTLFALPIPLLAGSAAAALGVLALLLALAFMQLDYYLATDMNLWWASLLALTLGMAFRLRRPGHQIARDAVVAFAIMVASVGLYVTAGYVSRSGTVTLLGGLALTYTALGWPILATRGTHLAFRGAGLALVLLPLFIASYTGSLDSILRRDPDLEFYWGVFPIALPLLWVGAGAVLARRMLRWSRDGWRDASLAQLATISGALVALLVYQFGPLMPLAATIAANAALAAIALCLVFDGMQRHALLRLNVGIVLALGLILLRLFESDIPRIVLGPTLIGAGLLLLALNYAILRHLRKARS